MFVQPIVAAEDKEKISELFATVPDDLQHLGGVNWEHIDRKDKDYFELGVPQILKAAAEAQAKAAAEQAAREKAAAEAKAKEAARKAEAAAHSRATPLHTDNGCTIL